MVNTVTFSSSVGGDNSTVTDDANAATGLDNYGYTTRLVPALGQVVAVAGFAVSKAAAAAASATAADSSAQSALNAPGTNATSTTSLGIATGSKTFTIQTGKAFSVGQTLVAASAAGPSNYMAGQVTAHNSGTGSLTLNVTQTGGSGTKADWVIAMGAIVSSTLPAQSGGTNNQFFQSTGSAGAERWAAALIPGNNLSEVTTPATARSNLGLAIGSNVQAYNANLQAIAGLTSAADTVAYFSGAGTAAAATLTSFGRSLIDDADAATARTTLGLVIGTNVQAQDAELSAIAGLTSAADRLAYFTGSGSAALATFTSFGRSLVDDADAVAGRATLGAAALGANSDITSLTGLTTPLSLAQGGAGGTDAASARTALGLAAHTTKLFANGLATVSAGSLTEQFSPGFTIARSSTGAFSVTLDTPAASANSWGVTWSVSNGTGATAEQVVANEQRASKTASVCAVLVRDNSSTLRDPDCINVTVYVDS